MPMRILTQCSECNSIEVCFKNSAIRYDISFPTLLLNMPSIIIRIEDDCYDKQWYFFSFTYLIE